MENKVSGTLLSLSAKAKSVEDKIETARTEAKEKLDARIAIAKTELEVKKEDFISKAENLMVNAETKNIALNKLINQKIRHLKAEAKAKKEAVKIKADAKKHEFDVHRAESDYNDAVAYAENCIEWAIVDLGDVETATLEAFAAKLRLEELKKANA